ncbi:MAG: hypothetical protein HY903_08210 [Deltaproteobacteria bacterium]|nr:hypothetical protein [Deltaproteobacteria bacterium]
MTDLAAPGSAFHADANRALARRGKDLLVAKDLPDLVAALEPLEAYFIVKELGVGDALPILKHATDEQLQTLIDLDCWRDDRPDLLELDAWLSSFAAESYTAAAAAFVRLDPELQVWLLAETLDIYEAHDESAPETPDDVPRMTTPDAFFVLLPRPEVVLDLEPFALVTALYAADAEEAYRLLTAARWELMSTLEEIAYGFRGGRLEDLGFPPKDEALRLFAPPPKVALPRRAPATPTRVPAVYMQPLLEGSLLTRALAALSDPTLLTSIESDVVYLINAAILAYGESPRDVTHVTLIAARVRDTVSLGLELAIGAELGIANPADPGAVTAASSLLATCPLRQLFQTGHAAVTALQHEARALASDPVVAQWLQAPTADTDDYSQDRRDRELLTALTRERPLYGGFDPVQPSRRKAFASRAELAAAEARLDAIANRVA